MAESSTVSSHAETEIAFDFPSEGYVFRDKDKVMLAVKVSHCSSNACGHIVMLLNGGEAGKFDMEPNEYGEIRAHISVPELPDGEFTAAVKLVDVQGIDLADHLYHDVGFIVDTSPQPEDAERSSTNPTLDSTYLVALMDACERGAACSDEQEDDLKCSGRGDCVRGSCLCHGGFAGETCEHDIFNNNTFIPDLDPMDSPSRCVKAIAWENTTRELTRDLKAASERPSCAAEHVLLFAAPPHGYGTNIHYLTVLLSKAYLENKALVMHGEWNYDTCGGQGFECHMLPLSACRSDDAVSLGVPLHARDDAISWSLEGAGTSHFLPLSLRTPYHGVLWWRAQLTAFLLRPNLALERRIREVENVIGYRGPVIGVQVRRGDSCSHAASSTIRPGCQPTTQYLSLVRDMIDRYGRDQRITVFLATDDHAVVEDFEAASKGSEDHRAGSAFKLVRVPVDRKLFESSLFIEYRLMLGYVDNKAVTDATMLDLFLLARADYFVGGFGSHFSRLAFELSVGIKGRVPPYASVDYPWCFHFMERKPIGTWPEQYC